MAVQVHARLRCDAAGRTGPRDDARQVGRDVFAEFEDDEEPEDDGLDPLGTYTVHRDQESSRGYAQPGKPVSEYLGLTGEETVAVAFEDDHLTISVGNDGDVTYATFERGGRGYAQFTPMLRPAENIRV